MATHFPVPFHATQATHATEPARGLAVLVPNATAILAVIACAIALAVTKLISTVFSASPALYLAGGIAILAIPAIVAGSRRALRPTGAEVLPAFAFYLSMYQAPLMRLILGGRPIDGTEIDVLEIALYASLGVSWLASLRPGAFDPHRAMPPPHDDASPHTARIEAYAGVATTMIGYVLLMVWIGSVGITRMSSASLTDVYQYGGGQTTVTFQWPFIVGGIVTMALAFARWPGNGPSSILRTIYYLFIAVYILTNARLGARGPTLELFAAIYFVRYETRHPVSRRVVLLFAALFTFFFFFVTAMRTHLDSGIEGTSADEVSFQATNSVNAESASEFDAVFENSAMIVRFAGNQIPYLNGDSWSDLPLQLVPRQLVGNKPLGLSAWWIQYVDPEIAKKGGGRAFGSFAEGYLNFGAPGAVAQVLAITVFLLALLPLLRAKLVGFAPAAAATLAYGYHCHRSELILAAFTLRNAIIVAVATLVARWFIAQLKPTDRAAKPAG